MNFDDLEEDEEDDDDDEEDCTLACLMARVKSVGDLCFFRQLIPE